MKSGGVIFTVGHSTRTVAELVVLLQESAVTLVVDVGWAVEHIMGPGKTVAATLTPGARVMGDGTIRYPAPNSGLRDP